MATNIVVEEITGTVTKVNGTGIHIAERPDWVNVSKFAKDGEAPMPAVGQRVKIGLDKSGYARTIEAVEVAKPVEQPKPEPAPKPQPAQQEPPRGALPSRDVAITRMACLNTATAILSSGNRACEAKDVVALAAKLECWVNR